MNVNRGKRCVTAVAIAVAATLTACGGDDDHHTPSSVLHLSNSTPSSENGRIDTHTAKTQHTEARTADAVVPDDYCAVTYTDATSSNKKTGYQIIVYFRQAGSTVVFASIADVNGGWGVDAYNTSLLGIDKGVTVDTKKREIHFSATALDGENGAQTTVNGTITYKPTPVTNACG